nr:MlaD family protein [Kiloniellales bacterium]
MSQQPEAPEVAIEERRGISMVWLIPVVAGAIAIWLGYTTISEQGPEITISFKTAAGLEPGKTKVKFREVEVGLVDEVIIKDDLSGVVLKATLDKTTTPHLNDETRFWVVRPRLGAGGVSGLGTLVSGAYVEIDPGGGNPRLDFVGLEVPPVITSDVPGTQYRLKSDRLGSLGPGDQITFRGIRVGQILGYELNEDNSGVTFLAFVQAPHDKLVRDDSRFYNASGLEIEVGAEGFQVRTESLEALLAGGIVFSTPLGALRQEQSAPDTEFVLYDSEESVEEAEIVERVPLLLYFDGSVRGLNAGAPVELRGLRIGTVKDVRLEYNSDDKSFRVPVVITIEPSRITILGE